MTLLSELPIDEAVKKDLQEAGFKLDQPIDSQVNTGGETLYQYAERTHQQALQEVLQLVTLKEALFNTHQDLQKKSDLKSKSDFLEQRKVLLETVQSLKEVFCKLIDIRAGATKATFFKPFAAKKKDERPSLVDTIETTPLSQFVLAFYPKFKGKEDNRDQCCIDTIYNFVDSYRLNKQQDFQEMAFIVAIIKNCAAFEKYCETYAIPENASVFGGEDLEAVTTTLKQINQDLTQYEVLYLEANPFFKDFEVIEVIDNKDKAESMVISAGGPPQARKSVAFLYGKLVDTIRFATHIPTALSSILSPRTKAQMDIHSKAKV